MRFWPTNSAHFTKIVSCGKMFAYIFVATVSERNEVFSYVDVTIYR